MRVITGSAKGRKLVTVEGTDVVRPTTDIVKEAIFSAIQFEIEGRRVLDLFAGSGQLGIEALSRGASECVFVDNAAPSLKAIRANIAATGFERQAVVEAMPFLAFLKSAAGEFDIAFLDPPYGHGLIQKALPKLVDKMADNGVILCEHEAECTLPARVGGFAAAKKLRHGRVNVTIYRREREGESEE